MKQECENAILEYAPLIRQHNAALFDEHTDYVRIVIELHRNQYRRLADAGVTEWQELDMDTINWLNENKPY